MNEHLIISPVLIFLLQYLHDRGIELPPSFDGNATSVLHGREFTTTKEYDCLKTDDGILDRAKWIYKGYGYSIMLLDGPDGQKVELHTGIFRAGLIMLDEDGFFNNEPTKLIYRLAKGTTAIPFSRSDFATLAEKVPEAHLLATKILSAQHKEHELIKNMMRMKGQTKVEEFERIFGKEVYQYFDRQDIAQFLGFHPQYFCRM